MRKILIFSALLTCIFLGCKNTKKEASQPGVYKLNKLTVSSGGKDSVYARTQIKIYTDDHFAYASLASDSSVGFGVGSYKADAGNKVTEQNIYSSADLDSSRTFHLFITRKDSSYTQVIDGLLSHGVKYSLTEAYTQLPFADTSKLDGLWKLDASYILRGKDTVKQPEIQYKVFWNGHFMFVHRYPLDNTSTRYKNGFGYGDFNLKNDTLSETEHLTSHPALMDRQFAIKITFKGDDEYSQVITDPKAGEQSVEIYRRIK
jgi:hypothetical protein